MNRLINISKTDGATVVGISANGKTSQYNYTGSANIYLVNSKKIAVADDELPFLVFQFHEIENKYGATNATEYLTVMRNKGFFQPDISSGGTVRYIKINGNNFEHKPLNPDSTEVEIGDVAINGWISNERFGKVLVFKGEDPENINNWDILEEI